MSQIDIKVVRLYSIYEFSDFLTICEIRRLNHAFLNRSNDYVDHILEKLHKYIGSIAKLLRRGHHWIAHYYIKRILGPNDDDTDIALEVAESGDYQLFRECAPFHYVYTIDLIESAAKGGNFDIFKVCLQDLLCDIDNNRCMLSHFCDQDAWITILKSARESGNPLIIAVAESMNFKKIDWIRS